MARRLDGLASQLLQPAPPGVLGSTELAGLPDAAARYLASSIAAGAPLARSARVRMRGQLKLNGRWLSPRARQVLAPLDGLFWQARVARLIWGSDRWAGEHGVLDWKIAGLFTVAHEEGSDVARSAQGRAAAGSAGWFHGTDRWPEGEFFRCQISALVAVGPITS